MFHWFVLLWTNLWICLNRQQTEPMEFGHTVISVQQSIQVLVATDALRHAHCVIKA